VSTVVFLAAEFLPYRYGKTGLTKGNGVTEMSAVVSRERARATCMTGAAGVLLLAVAFMMMMVAAPAQGQGRLHGLSKPSAIQLITDVCHQLTSRSDSTTVRACRAGPAAVRAWAEAYVPSMTSEIWSASNSGRATLPPRASSAVS